ncbi:protein FAM3C [Xyrichtys novacula]|uniref:Protein FAM3C n=1 Tax=Xyrichtys novacula TaxID=13765 RepID=A0AAV1EPJ5_XYRNO|nr:protein FAM3C [Xyrichtys novacula]
MRCRGILEIFAVLAGLLILLWGLAITFDIKNNPLQIVGFHYGEQVTDLSGDKSKRCSLPEPCPPESFPFHIWSGAANVVGPKICFDGKVIMSHVLNNVGSGINIVVIDGESGAVEKFGFLNMEHGDQNHIVQYLKAIKPGSIVLVGSFIDLAPRLTDEVKEIFEGMGSGMIKTIKSKDGWVFAGKAGAGEKSLFEKVSVNDKETNIYDEWPRAVEIGGCFPKTLPTEDDPKTSGEKEKI